MWRSFYQVELPTQKREAKKEVTKTKVEVKENIVTTKYENLAKVTMDFVADFEGFHECAYWDVKQWSIWYGTKSYKWECITREEAKNRKAEVIKPILAEIPSCFTDNQKIAIISYQYNTWGNQRVWWNLSFKQYVQKCDKRNVLRIMNSWGWNMPWLIKRRTIEISKFNTL